MSLYEQLKKDALVAMKERHKVKQGILKLVIGDLDLVQNSKGQKGDLTDDQVVKVVESHVKKCDEQIAYQDKQDETFLEIGTGLANDSVYRAQVIEQKYALSDYLPKYLNAVEIKLALSEVDITGCDNLGKSIGLAMKSLKGRGLSVRGDDVKKTVIHIRIKNGE